MNAIRTASSGHGSPRVLIVEDNDSDYLLLLRRVRKLLGPDTCERAAMRAELIAALSGVWDLIITDLHLPDIEGRELLDKIATTQPDTPCLAISGSLMDIDEAGLAANVFGIIEKGDNAGLQSALEGNWQK